MARGDAVCGLCGATGLRATVQLPGYQEGNTYNIYDCLNCGTAMAAPLCSLTTIYQMIYTQPEQIPGYSRYAEYAHEIKKQTHPLKYLESQEECYWAIAEALRKSARSAQAQILEVGCGLGYLTYALRRSGYLNVLGIDLSASAIAAARSRYGDYYQVADVAVFSTESPQTFDAIVVSEVIEHLESPIIFLRALRASLKPNGFLICTTPNRDFGGWSQQPWATELPPVHLWWFGESSMNMLARRCDMTVSFIDFTLWNRRHYRHYQKALLRSYCGAKKQESILDKNGSTRVKIPTARKRSSLMRRALNLWHNAIYRLRFPRQWRAKAIATSPCLAVIFQRADTASKGGQDSWQ